MSIRRELLMMCLAALAAGAIVFGWGVRMGGHRDRVQWATSYAQSWTGFVKITNENVSKETDGGLYVHVQDPDDFMRASVWLIPTVHPDYEYFETAARAASLGVEIRLSFVNVADPGSLDPRAVGGLSIAWG